MAASVATRVVNAKPCVYMPWMPLLPYCLHPVAALNKPSISKAACKQITGRFFVYNTDTTLYISLLQAAYASVSDEL